MGQWLGLSAFTAVALDSISGQEPRSHKTYSAAKKKKRGAGNSKSMNGTN